MVEVEVEEPEDGKCPQVQYSWGDSLVEVRLE